MSQFRKKDVCANCHTYIGESNYCPNCGQVNSHRQIPLVQILQDLLGDYFTFDSRFFRSIKPLLFKPGFLTREYLSGKRVRYILPLRLYIFTTFLFFFVLSLISTIDPYGLEKEAQEKRVAADSVYSFFINHPGIDSLALRELSSLLTLSYDIKSKNARKKSTVPDSLVLYFSRAGLPHDTLRLQIWAKALYQHFRFFKAISRKQKKQLDSLAGEYYLPEDAIKTSKTKPKARREMRRKLRQLGVSEIAAEGFMARIDKSFYYSVRKGDINAKFTLAGSDSAEIPFLRRIEKKGEKLFSQGNRGLSIFFNELIQNIPKVMFLLLPFFALLLKLFYMRQKILYINHLILALHLHSVIFIYLVPAVLWPNGWLIAAIVVAIWFHLFLSLRAVYRQGIILTFFKLSFLLFFYYIVLVFGFIILSVFTVYAV